VGDIKKTQQRDAGICVFCAEEARDENKTIKEFAYRKVRRSFSSEEKVFVCERHIIEKGCLK